MAVDIAEAVALHCEQLKNWADSFDPSSDEASIYEVTRIQSAVGRALDVLTQVKAWTDETVAETQHADRLWDDHHEDAGSGT